MKFRVRVMPKPESLDPQGRAVQGALHRLGFEVQDCRIGKLVEVELPETDRARARAKVEDMATKLLSNPLIESFSVEDV